ncbi:uncharacterized protein BDV17DRAFT_290683 [Aspergillus undulatus]|uniref:uncharacterized protein n=1 Tax=Aspergillus undulatus TaxID=1810928 RepID=UPI003CCD19F6
MSMLNSTIIREPLGILPSHDRLTSYLDRPREPPNGPLRIRLRHRHGGRAVFKWLGNYTLKPRTLWSGLGRKKILWEHHGSTAASKRGLLPEAGGPDRFIPLYNLSSMSETDGVLSPRSLEKRITLEDVPAFNGGKPFFTCNDGGQCSSGGCAGDACEWNPNTSQSTRKHQNDDDNDDEDPMDVDPT